MKIYLFRHGETDWNKAHKVQGHSDIPLNENGIRQAEAVAEKIADIPFDAVFASPLVRARKTAEVLVSAMKRKLPITYDRRLIEIGFGVEEGDDLDHIMAHEDDPLHSFIVAPHLYVPPEGGESIDDVWNRFHSFFDEMVSPLEKAFGGPGAIPEGGEHNVLIVAHGALARAVTSHLIGRDRSRFWGDKKMGNLALNLLDLTDGRLTLIEEAVDML